MTVKVFQAKSRARRYRVEFLSLGGWVLDDSYHTYLAARYSVALWNSISHDARIVDTRANI